MTSAVISDTLSWVHGNHTIKFGGEVPPPEYGQLLGDAGHLLFSSVTAFLADQAVVIQLQHGQPFQPHV